MLVRMRKNVLGGFCGIQPAGGDCVSVYRGQLVDVPEKFGLQLIMNGTAQTGGGDLERDGKLPPPRELATLRQRIAELTPPDIRDQAYAQLAERRKTGRPATQAETDTLRRALTL